MFYIRENHPKIDFSGIDFPSLRGVKISNKDDGEDEDAEVEDDQEVTMDDLFNARNDSIIENHVDPVVDMSTLDSLVTKSVPNEFVTNESITIVPKSIPNVTNSASHPTDV